MTRGTRISKQSAKVARDRLLRARRAARQHDLGWPAFEALLRSLDLREVADRSRRPSRDNIRVLQNELGAALANEDFRLDCIERELCALARAVPECSALSFCKLEDIGIAVRMFYWRPHHFAPPHEHTSWTVAGVFHNTLQVTTFDREIAKTERRLQPREIFLAAQGSVGHIYDPCIHRPGNPTDDMSASIHVFNQWDRPTLTEEVGPIEGLLDLEVKPFEHELEAELQAIYVMHVRMLLEFTSPRALELLDTIDSVGDDQTRGFVSEARSILRSTTRRPRLLRKGRPTPPGVLSSSV